ncbi:MAG: glycosyltransferase [Ignavibacteria bacterium]|nr:glycosyltransferase [Ignavibacteria bacterium]
MILENRNIIVFADDWGRHPSTMQHLGKVLAKNNRLMWVGSLALRKLTFNFRDFKRLIEKFRKIFSKNSVSEVKEKISNILEVHPFVLPFHDVKVIRFLNKMLLFRFLNKIIILNHFHNPIVISSSPIIYSLLGKLGETSSHYICLDDYSLFSGAFKSLIELEKRVLEKVDSSFSVSKPLLETRVPKSGVNNFLPQGVEVEHFSKVNVKNAEKLSDIKKPIIGFFGLISEWVNIEILSSLAKTFPNCSIVLIGDAAVEVSQLRKYSNIYLLGKVPYTELPSYASNFDVGIIPFKINELTAAVNPLKLIEYLALGLPVVTTPMCEVEKFKEYIYIANDSIEFNNMVALAIKNDTMEMKEKRKKIVLNYSWEVITDGIGKVILEVEKRKVA